MNGLFGNIGLSTTEKKERRASAAKLRQDAIDAAMEKAGRAFCDAFRKFVLEFGQHHAEFATENVIRAFKRTGLPKPTTGDYRATGGIIQSLKRRNQITFVRYDKSETRKAPIEVFRIGD